MKCAHPGCDAEGTDLAGTSIFDPSTDVLLCPTHFGIMAEQLNRELGRSNTTTEPQPQPHPLDPYASQLGRVFLSGVVTGCIFTATLIGLAS